MLVQGMNSKEYYIEHFSQINYSFLDAIHPTKEYDYVGYSFLKDGKMFCSTYHTENVAKSRLREKIYEKKMYSEASSIFLIINRIKEIKIDAFEMITSLQYIKVNCLEDWRFTGYIRISFYIKENGEFFWNFFDISTERLEVNIIGWVYELIRYSTLPIQKHVNIDNMILASGKPGVIFHEIGHLYECDNVYEEIKTSFVSDFSLIDNPLLRQYNGSYSIDDCGNLAKETKIIEHGQSCALIGGYMNRYYMPTSRRRKNYTYMAIPRMSVTFLDVGKDCPENIIQTVDDGIYIKSIINSFAVPKTRTINFCNGITYPIKAGKIDKRYRCTSRNTQVKPEVILNGIRAIGNDLQIVTGRGLCNKKGQEVVCSYGMPTTHIIIERD